MKLIHLFISPGVLLVLIALGVVSFFLSASEASIISLSKIRLRHLLKQGVKHAQNIQRLVIKLDKFIAAILIGNNIVNIAISSIVTGITVQVYGYKWGVFISTFLTTFILLIFCEITPKILATKHTEKVALSAAPLMEFMVKFLHPLIVFFIGISGQILRLFGVGPSKRSPLITEEELRTMIEVGREDGVLSEEERRMLHRIFDFGDIKLSDVMVPKDKIVAVNINTGSDDLLNIFVEEAHARIPVYQGSIDNIIGIVYARDLLYILREKGLFLLQDLIQEACYVSGTIRVNELLKRFQAEHMQIAIVVDKNRKTLGLVTLEDLLEEIVGEIEEKKLSRKKAA